MMRALLSPAHLSPALLSLALGAVLPSAGAQALGGHALTEYAVEVVDVSRPGEAGKTFLAATIVDAPVRRLCDILLDYPQYPRFMPNTADTRVVRQGEDGTQVDMTLALPLGKVKKYRLQMDPKPGEQSCRLGWKLVPSGLRPEETIADTTGHWLLVPHPADARKTVVEYEVQADPGPVPFGLGWIVDYMSRRSLPRTLEAVRERAAQMAGAQ